MAAIAMTLSVLEGHFPNACLADPLQLLVPIWYI